MKKAEIIKCEETSRIKQDLEKINAYTRRKFEESEVYIFSVVLCDNDVDRDYERFTVEALFEMEKLFVGKTGICDHDPKAENQKARIFECKVEAVQGRTTATGDEYFRLVAKAYMPKTEENAAMISRIDSGICKEVSVGCASKKRTCSVCSRDTYSGGCHHIGGKAYDGEVCYFELSDITDAYEWSFVAVPAQRAAGVIKSHNKKSRKDAFTMNDILKSLNQGEAVTLSIEESRRLADYLTRLEKRAEQGDEYREELEKEVLRFSAMVQPEITEKTMTKALGVLDTKELREFLAAYKEKAKKKMFSAAQLTTAGKAESAADNTEFSI